jgi:hypothetical protein
MQLILGGTERSSRCTNTGYGVPWKLLKRYNARFLNFLTMTSDLYAWMRHVKVEMFVFIEERKQQSGGID